MFCEHRVHTTPSPCPWTPHVNGSLWKYETRSPLPMAPHTGPKNHGPGRWHWGGVAGCLAVRCSPQ